MTDGEPPPIVHQLADLAVTPAARVPDEVLTSVGQRVLDILGICVRATTIDTSKAVTSFAVDQGGTGQATAVGVTDPLPAPSAAFVNGVLAHSLDYDDTHLPSVLHPSASVVPAVLAAGQAAAATGAQMAAAIAGGIEITVRLGMAGYDRQARASVFFDRGQHATSICGAIGAAAGCAAVAGADAAAAAHAMGIAASMASGLIEANRTGGTVKRLHCGWAAQAGVTAAELARRGLTGPPTVLEGRFGLFTAHLGDAVDLDAVTDGLGERWEVPGIFFKPYPANHFTHAGIDAAIALRERGLSADDMKSATLGVAASTARTIGQPLDVKRRPETGYQAQFSGPYTVVAGLLGGGGLGLGLDDFTDELAADPWRRELMDRVTVVGDDRCDEIFPEQFPAVLTVTTTDGDELTEEVLVNRGGPANPLSADELATKFADNTVGLLDPDATSAVTDSALALGSTDRSVDLLGPLASVGHSSDTGPTPAPALLGSETTP